MKIFKLLRSFDSLLVAATLTTFQSACSTKFFEDLFASKKQKSLSAPIPAVAFNSSEIPDMDSIHNLTLLQLAKRTLQLTKMVIKNDEFLVDEYRYYSVQTAYEDLVHELREDINQYWTVQQHLDDLEVDPADYIAPLTFEEYEITWAVAEELLDLKINQIGNIKGKSPTDETSKLDSEKSSEVASKEKSEEGDERAVNCETPGKDIADWRQRIPLESDTAKCVSHVHFLFGSVKRDSAPLLRDAACQDFAFAKRLFEQQRNATSLELAQLSADRVDSEVLERGKQLRAEQAAAIYGFIQSAKMYMTLQCVGHGMKPGEY